MSTKRCLGSLVGIGGKGGGTDGLDCTSGGGAGGTEGDCCACEGAASVARDNAEQMAARRRRAFMAAA